MKKLMLVLPVLAISLAHADELKTIRVPSPIKINQSSQYPDGDTVNKISEMNLKLRAKSHGFLVNYTADVLKEGRLYTPAELAEMNDLDQVAAIMNSDHCEISDAYDLYKHGSSERSLKGDLLLQLYTTSPLNVMTTGSGTADGQMSVTQILQREYFVVKPNHHDSLLGMIRCYTTLESSSSAEAIEKENAYEAAGAS